MCGPANIKKIQCRPHQPPQNSTKQDPTYVTPSLHCLQQAHCTGRWRYVSVYLKTSLTRTAQATLTATIAIGMGLFTQVCMSALTARSNTTLHPSETPLRLNASDGGNTSLNSIPNSSPHASSTETDRRNAESGPGEVPPRTLSTPDSQTPQLSPLRSLRRDPAGVSEAPRRDAGEKLFPSDSPPRNRPTSWNKRS